MFKMRLDFLLKRGMNLYKLFKKKPQKDIEEEYVAFISYKEEDYEWARWLQHKLEHYHIPIEVREKHPEYPQRVKPVFEYKSEMAGGNLSKEIAKALDNSTSLIVICSPNTPGSEWVAKEVQHFINDNREDKIIPFVIAGEPFSKDRSKECFPKPLLKLNEIRGININEMGRDAAAVKVVAQMFNVKFDTLWRRYEKEQKRKRTIIATALFLFSLIVMFVALWIWHLNCQLTDNYRKLAIENIRKTSLEIVRQIDQGLYVEARNRLNSMIKLWQENSFQQQDAPEFEAALRTMYRQMYKDGLIKLYSLPISDKQRFIYADSCYLYIMDSKEDGHDVLLRYNVETGDSAARIFPLSERKDSIYFCNMNGDELLYRDSQIGTKRSNIYVYNIKSKREEKIYIDDGNCFRCKVLSPGTFLFVNRYDGKYYPIDIVRLKNGQKESFSTTFPFSGEEYYLHGDSLCSVHGTLVEISDIKKGHSVLKIDYRDDDDKDMDPWSPWNPQIITAINPNTKQFANFRKGYGVGLFSVDTQDSIIIDNTLPEGSLAMNASGDWLAYAESGGDSLYLFSPKLHIPVFKISDPGIGRSHILSFAGDDILIASDGSQIRVYSLYANMVSHYQYSIDGDYYIQYKEDDGGTIELINDESDEQVSSLTNYDINPVAIVISPQNNYLIAKSLWDICFYSTRQQDSIMVPFPQNSTTFPHYEYDLSEDESTLIYYEITDRPILYFYEVKNKKQTTKFKVDRDLRLIDINADGSKFAISDESRIAVYYTDSINMVTPIELEVIPNTSIRAISFGQSVDMLMVSYSDGSLRLWDTKTGLQIANTIRCKDGEVLFVDMSKDNQYVIGTVCNSYKRWCSFVWHIPTGHLVDQFTNEWAEFVRPFIPLWKQNSPKYQAFFSRGDKPCIIINENGMNGLSRKYPFLSFDELIDFFESMR